MGVHPKVERALKLLRFCIIDLLINSGGKLSVKDLEKWTGLLEVGPHITTEVVFYMARLGILNVKDVRKHDSSGMCTISREIQTGIA